MKAKPSTLRRNLNRTFYLFISASVVFSACFLSPLNKNNVLVNNTITWISDCINGGAGYDFVKADGNKAFIKSNVSGGLRMEEPASLYSNYEYAVTMVASGQDTEVKASSIEGLASATSSGLNPSGLMASVPADLLASMSQSQIETLSKLTSNMSQDQVIAKLKEDKSFRQNIASASGIMITKNLSSLAADY